MGTTTTNLNLYKPDEHEDGWADEFNANLDTIDTRLQAVGPTHVAHADPHPGYVREDRQGTINVLDYGAVGDGVTNDSAAIQAAIDTHAKRIYFPARPVGQFYGIGTSLVPYGSQEYVGDGADHPDYYRPSSELRCISSNAVMWDCSGSAHADFCIWRNLGFVDKVGPGGSGGVDTFFKNAPASSGTGYSLNGCKWIDCVFAYGQWAIDVGVTGFSLSNWLTRCKFHRPAIRNLGSFPNNWHFTDCTWNNMTQQVPAVEAGTGTDVVSSGPANGWFFEGGYTESLQRQFIKWIGSGLTVHDFYVEAINDSTTTYTSKDGRTLPLPWVDVCNNDISGPSRGVEIGGLNLVGPGNTFMVVGSTVFTNTSLSGRSFDFTMRGQGFGWQNLSETRTTWDLSAFKEARGLPYFDEYLQSGSVYNLPFHDAQLASTIVIAPNSTSAITIPNPTNATAGRKQAFEFISDNVGTLGTITWGSKYVLESVFASPANNKMKSIAFVYNLAKDKWYETGRTGELTT